MRQATAQQARLRSRHFLQRYDDQDILKHIFWTMPREDLLWVVKSCPTHLLAHDHIGLGLSVVGLRYLAG